MHQAALLKRSPGAVVKLLPCDHEVMGLNPENNLLQKCRERVHETQSGWTLSRNLHKRELHTSGCPVM
jgi:hypothetical protein